MMAGAAEVSLTVNGCTHRIEADPTTPLLMILRNDLQLNGPKFGCGLGECGACTVLIDGRAARACCLPLRQVGDLPVVTLEGLATEGRLDPVQTAFVEEQAAQCGYCLNGMIMTIHAFRNFCGKPTYKDVQNALRFNLCRCGAHVEIMRAACIACGIDPDARAGIG